MSSLILHALQHDAQCCSARYVDTGLLFAASTDTPGKTYTLYRCAMDLIQCTAPLFTAEWMPHRSVQLCQPCWKQPCVSTNIPMKICSSYNCAPTHPSSTEALLRAKCISHCSEVLLKADCRTVLSKSPSPLSSAAMQNRLPTGLCQCKYTVKTCGSYSCAVTQHQCTATLFLAKCSPHCSVLLCTTGSQQASCHCIYTHGDLLCIQVCSDPAPMHCGSVQCKLQSPLFSGAERSFLSHPTIQDH